MNLSATPSLVAAARRARPEPGGLRAEWASSRADVRAAQRLRYRVFVEEGGAELPGSAQRHELDAFDPWRQHLLVRREPDGEVVGTYRVLTPENALRNGGLFADTEFDLAPLETLRPRLVELGRACVDAEHRHGGVILALWGALARFMRERGLDTMIGSVSVPMRDGGFVAASLWHRLGAEHLARRRCACGRRCRCRSINSTAWRAASRRR